MYKLLLATAAAQYSADLKCGKCISEGYNFCFQGNDTQQFDRNSAITATCCQDETCSQMDDASYTCSKSYSDTDYALTFCPQPKNKCGQKSEIDFSNNVNVTEDITIDSMEEGDVCTYKIKARGGAPAFMLKNETGTDCSKMEIKYVEYNEYNINATETTNSTSKPKDRKQQKPSYGMPGRNASVSDAGKQSDGNVGQQKAPARRYSNGTKTSEETTEERKQKKFNYYKNNTAKFDKENKDGTTKKNITENESKRKPKWMKAAYPTVDLYDTVGRGSSKEQRKGSSSDEESSADMGYGKMTKGEYNGCGGKGTYKTFGSVGQGSSKFGVKDDSSTEDEPRTMMVTIRAKQNITKSDGSIASAGIVGSSASAAITLQASSNEFTDTNAYYANGLDSGAIKATVGLAAVLAFAASF